MTTLVFDIETTNVDWDSFDEVTQERLLALTKTKEEVVQVKANLNLSPFTGSLTRLAMYDIERSRGVLYSVEDMSEPITNLSDNFLYKHRSEKEILEEFWEGVQSYDVFVTFNGYGFDVPFLLHRSVIQEVKPTHLFAHSKYLTRQGFPYHVDLLNEVTRYGAMSKRPPLQMVCNAYSIKIERKIPYQSVQNVIATTALYEKWKQYLAPASFLNATES